MGLRLIGERNQTLGIRNPSHQFNILGIAQTHLCSRYRLRFGIGDDPDPGSLLATLHHITQVRQLNQGLGPHRCLDGGRN